MAKDPTIAVRDCLAEIAILREIATRMTLQAFRNDAIARRAGIGHVIDAGAAYRRLVSRTPG
jgi:uncharacterized protein with HEPN domain